MEHTQSKYDLFEVLRSVMQIEEGQVTDRFLFVTTCHVGLQTLWWLISHLDSILQNQNWEII